MEGIAILLSGACLPPRRCKGSGPAPGPSVEDEGKAEKAPVRARGLLSSPESPWQLKFIDSAPFSTAKA